MAKPVRVRYTGVAAYADDTQLDRIQALGSSTALNSEDIKELGTLTVVEVIDDIPQVDITMDANEYGSNKTAALLTNKSFGARVWAVPSDTTDTTNKITIDNGSYVNPSGVRIPFTGGTYTMPSASGSYSVYLKQDPTANPQYEVKIGAPTVASSFKIATVVCDATGHVTAMTDERPASFKTITVTDFELTSADIYAPIKQSGGNPTDSVNRTLYMEDCFVNRYDMNYQVQGNASESFGMETDNKRWFLNSASNIVADYIIASGATATISQTPVLLNSNLYMLKVTKNGTEMKEGTDFTVSGKTLTFTPNLVAGDVIKARYCSSTGGKFYTAETSAVKPGAIKEGQIEVYLKDGNNVTSQLLRCQSVRISLPLRREALYELGHLRAYERPLELPIELTVSVEIKDSDLEFMAKMANVDLTTVKEIAITDFIKTMSLIVKIYKKKDEQRQKMINKYGASTLHPDCIPLKIITVDNLAPTNENWDVRVDSDASQTFDFKTYSFSIES